MSQGREAEAPADPCLLLEAVAWLVLAAPVGAFPGERLADGRTIAIGLAPTPADLDRAAAAAPAADTARSGLAANTNAQGYHVQPCSAHGRDTFTCPVIFAFPEGTVTVYFAVARELERRRERGRWAGPWRATGRLGRPRPELVRHTFGTRCAAAGSRCARFRSGWGTVTSRRRGGTRTTRRARAKPS